MHGQSLPLHFTLRPLCLMLTLIGSGAAGFAQADQAAESAAMRQDLATPDSRIEIGLGGAWGSTRSFGEYNGLGDHSVQGLLNLNLVGRDETTGTWLKLRGRNLGQDSRELRFDHERQGSWAYFLEASTLTRHEPLEINTGLQGIGSAAQTVSATAPKRDVDLALKHEFLAAGGKLHVNEAFQFRVSARQDTKQGDRMYGRGGAGTVSGTAISAQEFLTQPIDQVTRQWDVSLAYTSRTLQMVGGYAGSSFDTDRPRLDVSGGSAVFGLAPALRALALPQGNQAHQVYLSGGYSFSDTTRTSFKLSRGLAERDDTFAVAPTRAGAPNSLNGRLETQLAMIDLTSRPLPQLDLHAALRHENRNDQTPRDQFLTPVAVSATQGGVTGFYVPRSMEQNKALLELGYQLSSDYRLVASVEEERLQRDVPERFRRIGYREETDETQARVELKASLAETLNGAVALVHADRGGSAYVPDTYPTIAGNTTNQLSPLLWSDRKRDKLRFSADWSPLDPLSVQVLADISADNYDGRTLGPMSGRGEFLSLDLGYTFNEAWSATAWLSREHNGAVQSTRTDPNGSNLAVNNVRWEVNLGQTTHAAGVGFRGKPRQNLEIGADLSYSVDLATYDTKRLSGTATINDLPDIHYHHTTLRLFADYALDRFSGVRAEFVHDRLRTDDWTWQNWVYSAASDGTRISRKELENASFLGIKYLYRWR